MLSITVGRDDLRGAVGRSESAKTRQAQVRQEIYYLVDSLMRQLEKGCVPVAVTVDVAKVSGEIRVAGLAKGG